ncbi:MAG: hemolysin III family protein [Erysipelotrichaceae bacterium]|nr:hemolysin III family protein [Erysipelotrichaceae bacterium]
MAKKESMRSQIKLSFGEELGNSVSHGAAAFLFLLLLPFSAVIAYQRHDWVFSLGVSVFIICIFLMLLTSCIYHSSPFASDHKFVMRILDHSMIFLAIAGTYTPILLSVTKGVLGMVTLIILWLFVVFGILYKTIAKNASTKITLIMYLGMGWASVILMPDLVKKTSPVFLGLIALGGLLYTVGCWFYAQKTRNYFHFIWHIFIVLACFSHYIAIVFFI